MRKGYFVFAAIVIVLLLFLKLVGVPVTWFAVFAALIVPFMLLFALIVVGLIFALLMVICAVFFNIES